MGCNRRKTDRPRLIPLLVLIILDRRCLLKYFAVSSPKCIYLLQGYNYRKAKSRFETQSVSVGCYLFLLFEKLLKRIKLQHFNSTTLIIPLLIKFNISKTEQYEFNLQAIEAFIHDLYVHMCIDHRILHQCFKDLNNVALVVLLMDIYTPTFEYALKYIFFGGPELLSWTFECTQYNSSFYSHHLLKFVTYAIW